MLRLSGDMPFSGRVVGVSPAPQVASLFNEGVWRRDTGAWSGLEVRRTKHAFLLEANRCSVRVVARPRSL